MLKVSKDPSLSHDINYQAVDKYQKHFWTLLNQYTYELKLLNGKIYYTFSTSPFETWKKELTNTDQFIQATEYLDRISLQDINKLTVESVTDVTTIVVQEYKEHYDLIFTSFHLVERIMQYSERKIVKEAIRLVQKSRENTESKRKYWRVLNEHHYGLDIHPLMEFEVDELEKILHACEHHDEDDSSLNLLAVLGGSVALLSSAYMAYKVVVILR